MKGKTAMSMMQIQGQYYNRTRSLRSPTSWSWILMKQMIRMSKNPGKKETVFHPILPNGLVVNDLNPLRSNFVIELKIGTKGMKKGTDT